MNSTECARYRSAGTGLTRASCAFTQSRTLRVRG